MCFSWSCAGIAPELCSSSPFCTHSSARGQDPHHHAPASTQFGATSCRFWMCFTGWSHVCGPHPSNPCPRHSLAESICTPLGDVNPRAGSAAAGLLRGTGGVWEAPSVPPTAAATENLGALHRRCRAGGVPNLRMPTFENWAFALFILGPSFPTRSRQVTGISTFLLLLLQQRVSCLWWDRDASHGHPSEWAPAASPSSPAVGVVWDCDGGGSRSPPPSSDVVLPLQGSATLMGLQGGVCQSSLSICRTFLPSGQSPVPRPGSTRPSGRAEAFWKVTAGSARHWVGNGSSGCRGNAAVLALHLVCF